MPCDAGATVRVDDAGRDSRASKGLSFDLSVSLLHSLGKENGKKLKSSQQ